MQWWDEGNMRDWQRNQLAAILSFATATVPYYQETLLPFDPKRIDDPICFLKKSPTITKDKVRDNFSLLQSTSPSIRRALSHSTSGSTGKPLHLRVDRPAFARYFAAKMRALGWHHVKFTDRQLRVWGLSTERKQQVYWQIRDKFQNRLRLVSFDLSDERLGKFFQQCLQFQPAYINGYTSAIHRFAQFIRDNNLDGHAFNARVVIPTAEVLLDKQADDIVEVFGCPVMNEYGCGEIQAIAYECPSGSLHISHENVFVEVLNQKGEPVSNGEVGLLTVTSFCNKAMPLIRYQNGDLVTLRKNYTCKCGRHNGLPILGKIIGRSSDVLFRTDGEPAHWTVIYYGIKASFKPGMIIEHQARQLAFDLIDIDIVKGPSYDKNAMNDFLVLLRDSLGRDLQINLRFVENIERENSGKLRYFISEMPMGQMREN